MQTLVDAKASLDVTDVGRWTLQHVVAEYGYTAAVQVLIDANAAVIIIDVEDDNGLELFRVRTRVQSRVLQAQKNERSSIFKGTAVLGLTHTMITNEFKFYQRTTLRVSLNACPRTNSSHNDKR